MPLSAKLSDTDDSVKLSDTDDIDAPKDGGTITEDKTSYDSDESVFTGLDSRIAAAVAVVKRATIIIVRTSRGGHLCALFKINDEKTAKQMCSTLRLYGFEFVKEFDMNGAEYSDGFESIPPDMVKNVWTFGLFSAFETPNYDNQRLIFRPLEILLQEKSVPIGPQLTAVQVMSALPCVITILTEHLRSNTCIKYTETTISATHADITNLTTTLADAISKYRLGRSAERENSIRNPRV